MDDPSTPLALLNIYEVVEEDVHRHFVCFLDPILAGAKGIDQRSVIGEFTPGPDKEFDLQSFRLNPGFIEAFTSYMNQEATRSPDMNQEAAHHASGWLYILDPRFRGAEGTEPEPSNLLGCFAVDESGQIVPNSFIYNENHQWFESQAGVSGVLSDRRFYDWMHPAPETKRSL